MPYHKKLLVPSIAVLFVVSFAFALVNSFKPVLNFFTTSTSSVLFDSLDSNPPPNIKDPSQMFNERGYYKSNSFSFDESEIINDFNGNLMYEIPLYNYKIGGEMPFEVKLTYNGSVGHQVFIGNTSTYNISAIPGRHTINSPEWILSVNGMAVQVFNFETNFFSNPDTSTENRLELYELNPLIPGYHFDDRLLPADPLTDPDRINILAGDGSVITLVNTSNVDHPYDGTYVYEGKELNYIAKVSFIEELEEDSYRNRRVELMKGDGFVYVYEERKRRFSDFDVPGSSVNLRRKPQMLLLKEIRDQVGNFIAFGYNGIPVGMLSYPYSRPLLSHITTGHQNIGFVYGVSGIRIDNYTDVNGPYFLSFSNQVDYNQGNNNNHTAMISNIRNVNGQEAVIAYGSYIRKYTSTPNPQYSTLLTLEFNKLKRITSFKNFLGGRRGYTYLDGGSNTLVIDLNVNYNHYIRSSIYNGYGRDAFYTNTINLKRDTVGGVAKSQHSFDYDFDDNSRGDALTKAVDSNDYYTTSRVVESLHDTTVNSSADYIRYQKDYVIYPLKPTNLPMEDKIDVSGTTKLVADYVYSEGNTSTNYELMTKYNYEKGSWDGGGLTGSFLMKQKTVTNPGQSPRVWNYDYTHLSDYDSPVMFKRETDPKGIKFETSFDTFSIPIAFMTLGSFFHADMYYYKINVPIMEEKYHSSTRLFKKTYEYIHDSDTQEGYYGQLKNEKIYNESGFSNYITTEFEYYKRDTLGKGLFFSLGAGVRPYVDGNIKLIKKPGGQEELYCYYPIRRDENKYDPGNNYSNEDAPPYPRVSYKIKYFNGTVKDTSLFISDRRLPSRISKYKRINSTTVDTASMSTIYMTYNDAGSPTRIINENRYLIELVYQPTHRIRSITLPGDFNTEPNDTSIIVYSNVFTDSMNIQSDGWGSWQKNDGLFHYTDDASRLVNEAVCKPFKFYKFYDPSTNPVTDQLNAGYIQFNNSIFNNLGSLDSAFLFIWPTFYNHLISNTDTSSDNIKTLIRTVRKLGTPTGECGGFHSTIMRTGIISNDSLEVTVHAPGDGSCTFYPQKLDIKNIINSSFRGVYLSARVVTEPDIPPKHLFDMGFAYCSGFNYQTWLENYRPYIKIHGTFDFSDTLFVENTSGGTYLYNYDDDDNTVEVRSRLTHGGSAVFKKVRYKIDGFGNVKQKDIFKTISTYDSLQYKFNYLNSLSASIDGLNHITKLSYDSLGRMYRTNNPAMGGQSSSTQTRFTYQSSLSSYFGSTYSGFVEKQAFTDETGRNFNKYFDAVGNLLREEKFVVGDGGGNIENEENPFDPDTVFGGQDAPAEMITLTTDYQYDKNYRLIKVKTPNGKNIDYWYDGYGRQMQRLTADASYVKYTYDNNGNLIYTQDAKQRAASSTKWTQRAYDGLNRLLVIGEINKTGGLPFDSGTGPEEDTTSPVLELDAFGVSTDSIYVVNVYDTLTTAAVDIFNANKPTDYYSAANFTRGNLVATAYRTRFAEDWNYKFYRYDARGRILKMWHYIQELGWKSEVYYYNSQNQLTRNWYQPSEGYYDSQLFTYTYDDAARLKNTYLYIGSEPNNPDQESDSPSDFYNLTSYTYNQNSQVNDHGLNIDRVITNYNYNERGWISNTAQTPGPIFRYILLYNPNGNIRFQEVKGSYNGSFNETGNIKNTYLYDHSNRLLKTDRDSGTASNTHDLVNAYDRDGNLVSLKRYGSSNNLVNNFTYTYFSNTNKLQKVSGGLTDDYAYDQNGNLTKDEQNRNYNILYDYRNLITDIRTIRQKTGIFGPEDEFYYTKYWYDEAGNRIKKQQWEYTGEDPDPEFDLTGDTPPWMSLSIEYYIRDLSGREISLYNDTSLTRWNIYGRSMIGHINLDTTKHYYLKDHLGSIRATINSTNTLESAQDYDAWGHLLQNRGYNAATMKYDFTGKERDNESNYDYFGARYFDSKIGRWGSVEPLIDEYVDFTPYCYSACNPIITKDLSGNGPRISIYSHEIDVGIEIYYTTAEKDPTYGLDNDQVQVLNDMASNMMEDWSGTFDIQGKGMIVNVDVGVNATEYSSTTKLQTVLARGRGGTAMAFTSNSPEVTDERGVGVLGNSFLLARGDNLRAYASSGSHELGHQMGLGHTADAADIKGKKPNAKPNNVMGRVKIKLKSNGQEIEIRNKPTSEDWNKIFKTLGLDVNKKGTYYFDNKDK